MATSISYPFQGLQDDWSFTEGMLKATPIQEYSQRSSGAVDTTDLGPAIWKGVFKSVTLTQNDAMEMEADLESLMGGLKTIKLYDPRRAGPLLDPTVDDSSCTITDIDTDRDRIKINGLPSGFETSKGDFIQIDETDNTYLVKALVGHDHSSEITSNSKSDWIPIFPTLPVAITAGDTVKLVEAGALFTIDPNSLRVTQSPQTYGYVVSFSVTQSIE